MTEAEEDFRQVFTRQAKRVGYGSLLLSALFLGFACFLGGEGMPGEANWTLALLMMAARTFGIAAFLSGAALLLVEQWTAGTLLFIFSVVLPAVSFVFLETV